MIVRKETVDGVVRIIQAKDYYKILQVHYQAEAEIIESSYKRLARKYHPDANPSGNSEEMMQLINEAYTILSDPSKRREYNRVWEDRNIRTAKEKPDGSKVNRKSEMMFLSAKAKLDEYFNNIMSNNYEYCYDLISGMDKRNITKEEFIKWQEAVSKVYRMTVFKCDIFGVYCDKLINGQMYSNALEFSVNIEEYNIVMDMAQRDNFTKIIILEEGQWRVFIGHEKLEPIISKFNELKGLLNAKTVLNELVENHCKLDNQTGLINQRGIMESIEREIERYNRYGNVFSMILCEVEIVKLINAWEEQEVVNHRIKMVGELLTNHLRKLDIVGRWSNTSLLILLPETGLISAINVTHKIQKLLKDKNLIFNDKIDKMVTNYGITEYDSSLEETLDRIYNQLR